MGQKLLQEKHNEGEAAKLGTLRGGSSGCITAKGTIVGKCHRLAHLRSLGHQEYKDGTAHIMFAAGYANEDIWLDHLKESWDGPILCEEEIPVLWRTDNDTLVSGRPDIVLCTLGENDEEIPALGLELKLVSSPFTAYNVAAKDTPNLDHIIQASHYMWQLNVPFKLVYSSRSNYGLGFPNMKPTWLRSPQYLNDEQFKTIPFIKVFDMWIEDGVVWYQGSRDPVETAVTVNGIQEYYNRVSVMGERKSLGPRPDSRNADGTIRSWKACDAKYCDFSETCDMYETDYDRWKDEAIVICNKET
jgi:hypothetical protein